MQKPINRTVAVGLICGALLLSSSCSKSETVLLEKSLTENVSQDAQKNLDGICYFACTQLGDNNLLSLVAYNKTNIFSSEEEQYQKFVRLNYSLTEEDFEEIKQLTKSFEAILPFEKNVLEKLVYITHNYDPTNISDAYLTDSSKQILSEIIKWQNFSPIISTIIKKFIGLLKNTY